VVKNLTQQTYEFKLIIITLVFIPSTPPCSISKHFHNRSESGL